MNEVSLFTGAGGGVLASDLLGFHHVAYCDFDKACRKTLEARIADGSIEDAPIFENVKTLDPKTIGKQIDIVTGGFPCQPFSQAGKGKGKDDERNQWPNTLRVLVESGAPLGFFENVPGLCTRRTNFYLGDVLGSLADVGFDAEWLRLGADDVGAPHQRKRLWILAHRHSDHERVRRAAVGTAAEGSGRGPAFLLPSGRGEVPGRPEVEMGVTPGERLQGSQLEPEGELGPLSCSPGEDVSDAKMFGRKRSGMPWHGGAQPADRGLWWDRDPADTYVGDSTLDGWEGRELDPQGRSQQGTPEAPGTGGLRDRGNHEKTQPGLGGLAHGLARWLGEHGDRGIESLLDRVAYELPLRTVRLRQLGNGQVPLTAAVAFLVLYNRAMNP